MWKPDKKDFTHYATFYGVPCYWNDETGMLAGRNIVCDWALRFMTVMHNYLIAPFSDAGFPIQLREFEDEKESPVKQEHEALPAEDARET